MPERPKGGAGRPGGFGRDRKPPDAVYRWEVYCLDRGNGKVLWKQTAAEKKPAIATHSSNTYATETPITDGERVYAYFGMTGLYCYDLTGKARPSEFKTRKGELLFLATYKRTKS